MIEEKSREIVSILKNDWLLPGAIIRIFYNEGSLNNQRMHIRAVVDKWYIVYKV